jgi:hypothetical protein
MVLEPSNIQPEICYKILNKLTIVVTTTRDPSRNLASEAYILINSIGDNGTFVGMMTLLGMIGGPSGTHAESFILSDPGIIKAPSVSVQVNPRSNCNCQDIHEAIACFKIAIGTNCTVIYSKVKILSLCFGNSFVAPREAATAFVEEVVNRNDFVVVDRM